MNKEQKELVKQLYSIFFRREYTSHPYIKFTSMGPNTVEISYGSMYSKCQLEFEHLLELSELFDTKRIAPEDHDVGGCETCDYWSDYGYDIIIGDIKNHLEVVQSLCNQTIKDKELSSCK